ncbi:hypothetical protein D3C75_253680 [compost metagenome]
MKLTYTLTNIGWADVYLEIGHKEIYMEPSYLSEPLIDLTRAIELLIPCLNEPDETRDIVTFEWDSEPAIHSWKITKISNEKIRIEIVLYVDGIKTLPGELLLNEVCGLNEFVQELVASLENLLKKHGLVGYRKQWYRQDFPISSYLQLKYYLENREDFPIEIKSTDGWIEHIGSNLNEEIALIKKSIML